MIVKNLRASQGRLKAEVVVGQNNLGGNVVMIVDVDRRRQDVQDAMTTFENLLLREAQAQIKVGAVNGEIDAKAREIARESIDRANARSKTLVRDSLTEVVRVVERTLAIHTRVEAEGMEPRLPASAVRQVVTSINQQIERQSA